MRLRTFQTLAEQEFHAIPAEFRRGVQGPDIVREIRHHEQVPGHYILGECIGLPPLGSYGDEHLSRIVLYYGSFVACADEDPDFDMAEEIRETVRHEIRHHIEDRAGIPDLRDEDEASDHNARRRSGLDYHPGFHRLGEPLAENAWGVDGDVFLEVRLDAHRRARVRRFGLPIRWAGVLHRIPGDAIGPGPEPSQVVLEGMADGSGESERDLVVLLLAR